jgi:threonine dehydratase
MSEIKPTEKEIISIRNSISEYIHETPVMTSSTFNQWIGAELWFKCENFQKMGAFKMRGAAYALSQLSDVEKSKGVITHSSGNFAQALALSAQMQGIKATIVMPNNAPQAKIDAVQGYGAEIVFCEPGNATREKKVKELQAKSGACFVHPSNQKEVILGNATAALELLQEQPDLDIIIVPVGGGGLLAGTCLAANAHNDKHTQLSNSNSISDCLVYGAEPAAADDAFRSLQAGEIIIPESTNTIADGLRTHLGNVNFPIIQKHCVGILCVEESAIKEAQQLVWERMKLVIEPSSAVALAAVLYNKAIFKGKKVGIILSGGNCGFPANY